MPFTSLGLAPELVRAVADEGYEQPTPIQQEAIPLALARGTDIVVATPGRLLDHMERGHVDFSRLEVLVLDEADRMLDMGFAPDVRRILRALPAKRQTMLFSATVSLEVDALARTALDSHASVEIGRRAKPAEGIEHVIVATDKLQKRG